MRNCQRRRKLNTRQHPPRWSSILLDQGMPHRHICMARASHPLQGDGRWSTTFDVLCINIPAQLHASTMDQPLYLPNNPRLYCTFAHPGSVLHVAFFDDSGFVPSVTAMDVHHLEAHLLRSCIPAFLLSHPWCSTVRALLIMIRRRSSCL